MQISQLQTIGIAYNEENGASIDICKSEGTEYTVSNFY